MKSMGYEIVLQKDCKTRRNRPKTPPARRPTPPPGWASRYIHTAMKFIQPESWWLNPHFGTKIHASAPRGDFLSATTDLWHLSPYNPGNSI